MNCITPLTHLTGYVDLLSTQDVGARGTTGPGTGDPGDAKGGGTTGSFDPGCNPVFAVEQGSIRAVLQPVNFLQACSHPVEAAHQKATAKGSVYFHAS